MWHYLACLSSLCMLETYSYNFGVFEKLLNGFDDGGLRIFWGEVVGN